MEVARGNVDDVYSGSGWYRDINFRWLYGEHRFNVDRFTSPAPDVYSIRHDREPHYYGEQTRVYNNRTKQLLKKKKSHVSDVGSR